MSNHLLPQANKYNNTCLMISSYNMHEHVVDYLLQHGANPNLKVGNSFTYTLIFSTP